MPLLRHATALANMPTEADIMGLMRLCSLSIPSIIQTSVFLNFFPFTAISLLALKQEILPHCFLLFHEGHLSGTGLAFHWLLLLIFKNITYLTIISSRSLSSPRRKIILCLWYNQHTPIYTLFRNKYFHIIQLFTIL